MKEGYRVKKADIGYAVCYKDKYERESIWITCYLKENAKQICDILNKDRKDKVYEPNKNCQNCTNRFICPTFKENDRCDGYNNEEVFIGLLKLGFLPMIDDQKLKEHFEFIKELQCKNK